MNERPKFYAIKGGFVAYTWIDGQQVNGRGATEQAALADLQANLDLALRLQARVAALQYGLGVTVAKTF